VSKFMSWLGTKPGRITLTAVISLLLISIPALLPKDRDVQVTLSLAIAFSIAAIGLTILVGTAGQLSLAHGFFVAMGAYGYTVLAGKGTPELIGFDLPPVIAAIGGVAIAGLFGLIFSPVAARLQGLYLGLASIALIFIGEYFFQNATFITGGQQGRPVHPFDIFGFQLSGSVPLNQRIMIGTFNFDGTARLWIVSLAAITIAYIVGSRIVKGRPGQALQLVRDNPSAAAAIGVPVQGMKAQAFVLSSMYAGVGGVFMALISQAVVPQNFNIMMSMSFLAMIIVGGLGSVGGAILGASLVTFLPAYIDKLGGQHIIPFVDPTGLTGISGGTISSVLFGLVVILMLIFEPHGFVGLFRRLRNRKASPKKKSK
jgi:branched-chain amino acid transport system permease protein